MNLVRKQAEETALYLSHMILQVRIQWSLTQRGVHPIEPKPSQCDIFTPINSFGGCVKKFGGFITSPKTLGLIFLWEV